MNKKPKTEAELVQELKLKKRKEFLETCNETLKPIFEKYSMQLVPVIQNFSTEFKVHYEASFAVQEFTKEEVKVQKGNVDKTDVNQVDVDKTNETLDTKSETNEGADSDNQTSTK